AELAGRQQADGRVGATEFREKEFPVREQHHRSHRQGAVAVDTDESEKPNGLLLESRLCARRQRLFQTSVVRPSRVAQPADPTRSTKRRQIAALAKQWIESDQRQGQRGGFRGFLVVR